MKYRRLDRPQAFRVNAGPPTHSCPLSDHSLYMRPYRRATSIDMLAAINREAMLMKPYWTTLSGIRTNTGDPSVAPRPREGAAKKPYWCPASWGSLVRRPNTLDGQRLPMLVS